MSNDWHHHLNVTLYVMPVEWNPRAVRNIYWESSCMEILIQNKEKIEQAKYFSASSFFGESLRILINSITLWNSSTFVEAFFAIHWHHSFSSPNTVLDFVVFTYKVSNAHFIHFNHVYPMILYRMNQPILTLITSGIIMMRWVLNYLYILNICWWTHNIYLCSQVNTENV